MRGARLEAFDELDFLGQHRLLALELRLLLLLVLRPLLFVEFVVAGKCGQRAAVDFDHLGDDAVHELAVVRGHQQRPLVALEERLQPDQALEIEMVARLVEQHGVGAHQQDAGERHPHLPAAGERADVALHHLLAEAQSGQHFARSGLERVAAEVLEPAVRLAVALDDRIEVVGLVGIGHRRFQLAQLGGDGAHRAGAVHHLGDGAAARHFADVLAEVADGDAAIDRHLAFIGRFLPGDHAEERRLAGAVGADQADLLPLPQRRRGLDEEEVMAVLLADGFETIMRARNLGDVGCLTLRHGCHPGLDPGAATTAERGPTRKPIRPIPRTVRSSPRAARRDRRVGRLRRLGRNRGSG